MGNTIRVLHVDDEPGFADVVGQVLRREDDALEVVPERSAAAALDRLEEADDIDCIVSDYDMSRVDGIEFLKTVRADRPDLPFILFTGKGSEEVASEALSAGATDYLQKGHGADQYAVLANRVRQAVEKHRSQQALADRTKRLEALNTFNEELLENLPVGLFRVDGDFTVTYVNPRGQELFGVPEDVDEPPSVGQNLLELPSVVDAGLSDTFAGLADGDRVKFETEFVSMYGKESHLAVKGVPLFDDETFDGAVIIYEDVTTQRDRRQTLEQRKERLEVLFDQAPDIILIHDAEGELIEVNETATEQLGYSSDELLSMSITDLHVDLTPSAARDLWERAAAGSAVKSEREFRHRDGSTMSVEVWVSPIEFANTEQIITVARDISERRAYERELRAERDRFRALFENTSDCIAEVSMEGDETIVERVNPAFERVFGYDATEIVGEQLDDFVTPESEWEEAIDFNRRAREGEAVNREVRRLTTDGPREFLHRSVPYTVEGEPRGHAVYTDITDRKEKERELERQNDRLENVLNVLSHDLRNPLDVASSHLDLARRTNEPPSDHLETVEEALDRMDSIIDTTLTLARQGQTVADTQLVAVEALVRQSWDMAGTADATLQVEEDVTIRGDSSRLKHLFENLFRNAVIHCGDDVTVRVGAMSDGFYVEDDGPGLGIEGDDRARVFEPGWTTTDEGSGFGLAIVKGITEAHGWRIEVTESDEGGARFEITGVDTG